MKTKNVLATFCTGFVLLLCWQGYAQPKTVDEAAKLYPFVKGGGYSFPPFEPATNTYPYTYIAGDEQEQGFGFYTGKVFNERVAIPEILPAEQDTNGNWGPMAEGMQVSLRFNQATFGQGGKVLSYIILRNTSLSTNQWWRNGPPDFGYHFILKYGTNKFTWVRPQQKHIELFSNSRGKFPVGDDPYCYIALPHAEGLAMAYVNRFFDLSRPGQYSLQVSINVPTADGKGTTNVVSGTATFEIVEK